MKIRTTDTAKINAALVAVNGKSAQAADSSATHAAQYTLQPPSKKISSCFGQRWTPEFAQEFQSDRVAFAATQEAA